MSWGRTLALALGTMKTVDLTKEVFTRFTGLTPEPYLKSSLATVIAWAVAGSYTDDRRERLELAAGVAGAAALLHEGYAVLSTASDKNRTLVLGGAAGRRVQRMPPL